MSFKNASRRPRLDEILVVQNVQDEGDIVDTRVACPQEPEHGISCIQFEMGDVVQFLDSPREFQNRFRVDENVYAVFIFTIEESPAADCIQFLLGGPKIHLNEVPCGCKLRVIQLAGQERPKSSPKDLANEGDQKE